MEIPLSRPHLNGESFIRFAVFLARFTREGDIQEMSEVQDFLTSPSCLEGFVFINYD